ncbi:MAG: threonylcarbamoyl-AMP synthase [Sphingomonadales bacterium]|nr:threonylcarbamoyl-AMP synthase [Sphingomonadales bacterium]
MTGKQKTDNSAKIIGNDDNSIKLAAQALKKGELVGLPTETVYGLAASAVDDRAVLNIFKAKERPSFNPLIVHVADIDMAMAVAEVTPIAKKLMHAFWPGPLTIVLKRNKDCPLSELVSAGLDTVALRSPNHPVAMALLKTSKLPLAAPSANKSGTISPTTAQHVIDGLGSEVAYVLDGGAAAVGIESTIISATDGVVSLLRPGSISSDMIEDVLGEKITTPTTSPNKITAPGQLASHYAPNNAVRLNADNAENDEFLLGFGDVNGKLNLSPSGDVDEAARNLFTMLRQADKLSSGGIAIAPIPNTGIGIAINDRIKRAAAPKS